MPKIDFERHGKIVQLCVSSFNAIMLACGLLVAAILWFGETDYSNKDRDRKLIDVSERVTKIEATMIGTVRDGQERTNARLTTLETQNVFILRSLDRLEAAVARSGVPPPRPQ